MSNGTAVSNDRVTLQVGERRYDVQTASDGEFSLTYRPVFLPVNTTTVPVQFIPEDTSLYLAANTTTTAQITDQTNTTITVSNSTSPGSTELHCEYLAPSRLAITAPLQVFQWRCCSMANKLGLVRHKRMDKLR